ncbi:MAG: hypothetical protein QM754_13675 [Tepidisphaeraceae bacterium]
MADPLTPLPYATPEYQRTKPATVGFFLGLLALGLIFLAGCFMIGILIVHAEPPSNGGAAKFSPAAWLLYTLLLYVFALSCGGGGAFMMTKAVKKLLES